MKGLAISQPWAELVVSGKKKIEVRTRNTNYRGWFYVYASRKDTKDEVVKEFGFQNLPTGVIIGKAFLKDIKKYRLDNDFYSDFGLHLVTREVIDKEGWTDKPKYGYIISKVEKMNPPIQFRGMTGFFKVDI